jgi:hypothetical protein
MGPSDFCLEQWTLTSSSPCSSSPLSPLPLPAGWESDMRNWNPAFLWQVGEPQGLCYQQSATVFTRAWSYGNATVDCAAFSGTVPTV